jgi:tetratricopeptide (TPR) repeat protein
VRNISLFLLVFFVLAPFTSAEWNRTSGLIDIPTARILESNVVRASTNWFFTFGEDTFPVDGDVSLSYGVANLAEVSAYMLTTKELAASLTFKIVDESDYTPAFAAGIQDVTANKWVSSVGGGEDVGFSDDLDYWTVSGRNPERMSAYIVATKSLGGFGEYTAGLGRGRFVGYGPRSFYFNSDVFFGGGREIENRHADAVGLFLGGSVRLFPNFYAVGEFDGRDVNAGLSYSHPYFAVNVALTHLEQLDEYQAHDVRLAAGISANNSFMYREVVPGVIAGAVTDQSTGRPLVATVTLRGSNKPGIKSSPSDGSYQIYADPGSYAVRVFANGYKWVQSNVRVASRRTSQLDFALEPKIAPEVAIEIKKRLSDGYNYYLAGNYAAAISNWQTVLKLDAGNEQAQAYMDLATQRVTELIASHRALALTYQGQGKLQMAANEWEEVLKLDPDNSEATSSLATVRAQIAERARVAEKPKPKPKPKPTTPTEKPKEKPKEAPKVDVEATYKAGISFYLKGQYKQAIAKFEQVLKANPNHSGAKSYLAKAKARLKAIEG